MFPKDTQSYRKELVCVYTAAYTVFMELCKRLCLTLALSLLVSVHAKNVYALENIGTRKPNTSEKSTAQPPAPERKKQKLSPEQRDALRKQIETAGKDIYPKVGRHK